MLETWFIQVTILRFSVACFNPTLFNTMRDSRSRPSTSRQEGIYGIPYTGHLAARANSLDLEELGAWDLLLAAEPLEVMGQVLQDLRDGPQGSLLDLQSAAAHGQL